MDKGGAQRVVSRLTDILSTDYKVYLILFEDTFMEYEYNAELINMDIPAARGMMNKIFAIYKRIRRLKGIKEMYNLDSVISFLDTPNLINILTPVKRCMTAVSIRNYTADELSSGITSALTRLGIKTLYTKADYIIPVSRQIAENYQKEYKIPKDKLRVIYNPYDIDLISELSDELPENSYAEFIEDSFVFAAVARQAYQKGYWHLIKAFSLAVKKHPNARLLIIGEDHQNGRAKALVLNLGLEDYVMFAGQQDNPFKFLKRSDVYVLSSLFEGFPNSLVEAMACGCAAVSADCKSGPREILFDMPDIYEPIDDLRHGDYGIIVPPMEFEENWEADVITDSEKKLAQAMIYLMENKKDLERYSELALKRAADFSYEKCRQEYINLIES